MALNESQSYRELSYPMGSTGMITKLDPSVLSEVQYQRLVNCVSIREGAIRSRNGYRNRTSGGISTNEGTIDYVHSLARVATGDPDPAKNYLYFGFLDYVFRMTSEDPPVVISSDDTGEDYASSLYTELHRRRWAGVCYRKTSSGTPYLYLAAGGGMRKDPLSDTSDGNYRQMLHWGIDPPPKPVTASAYEYDTPGPDPPASNLEELITPYNYVYTFRNPLTGTESNPSIPLVGPMGNRWTTGKFKALVTVWFTCCSGQRGDGVSDADTDYRNPEVIGKKTIALYRSGGSFSDSYYRLVAYLDVTDKPDDHIDFSDNVPDTLIASNPIADFDNDPPVTSTMPVPLMAILTGDYIPGSSVDLTREITLEVQQPEGADLREILRAGSRMTIGLGNETQETVWLRTITESNKIIVDIQNPHYDGETVTCGSICNQPCNLACEAFNSLFLAGDSNNRNILYKSKTGRPEAFPVVNLSDNSPGSVEVGTPSDHIMNLTEYGGQLVCLNKAHLYLVPVWQGAMQTPQKAAAQRGLFAPSGWCKADNELWYIAYDGIYSWSGGVSTKRTEAIDPIFRGEYFNGFYPISFDNTNVDVNRFTNLDKILFAYRENEIFITYVDTEGDLHRLRYHTLYDRWSSEDVIATAVLFEEDTGSALFATAASGIAELNVDETPIALNAPSTTDGWTIGQDDGTQIDWEVWTGWYAMGAPTMQKQFGDVVLEYDSPGNNVSFEVYYDFSATPAETFIVPAYAGRTRIPLPLQSAKAQEAYTISLRMTGTSYQPTNLHSLTFHFLTLEDIQRGHAADWDNLGYPHDKRLTQVSIEYDVSGTNATLNLDTMGGIGGATQTLAVQTFTLSSPASTSATGPTRARTTFPISDGIVAKLVRLRPTETSHNVKLWPPNFDFIQYPPDKVLFTEWDELGYPCEKVLRDMILSVDTGGVEAAVNVQADGVTKRTFSVKTTMDNRHVILTLNKPGDEELLGKQFRTLNVPGTGGKFQLFKPPQFNAVREPCVTTFWDSFEQSFGYNGWKLLKQMWIQYLSCSPVILRVYADNRQLLMTTELPRHTRRDVERVYLPDKSALGVLNKSKVYSFTGESCDPCCGFYLYADETRVEWMPVGADMRQGYQQFTLLQPMERTAMP